MSLFPWLEGRIASSRPLLDVASLFVVVFFPSLYIHDFISGGGRSRGEGCETTSRHRIYE